jgi:hypothetical protein
MSRNLLLSLTILFLSASYPFAQKNQQARTIITTDGEIDDVDSFIRMLLYSNEFRIEGLIYSSSMWHYKGDGKGTRMVSEMEMTKKIYGEKTDLRWPGVTWIQDLLAAYQKVYPNLILHKKGFPKPDYLRSLIKVGNIDFEGEMEKDTEGSDFIKAKLLDNTSEPIYLQVWGGTNTIARALKSIELQYKSKTNWNQIYAKVAKKAIIYAILDQDATYKNYISKNWPSIKIYYNSIQFGCLAYPWKRLVPLPYQSFLEGEFMKKNIVKNHGPLLEMYYSYGDSQKQVGDDEHIHGDSTKLKNTMWGTFGKYDFISEGDSPAYLHLIDIGLDNLQNPSFGGWGGRLIQSKSNPNRWEDGGEVADYNTFTNKMDTSFPQTRWLEVIQNDFASRADWCVKPFSLANHPPVINLKSPKKLLLKAGAEAEIIVSTFDIDKNKVDVNFWQYNEAGNTDQKLVISQKNNFRAKIKLPISSKKGDIFHVIVEGKDNGIPNLTRYQRVVIEVVK